MVRGSSYKQLLNISIKCDYFRSNRFLGAALSLAETSKGLAHKQGLVLIPSANELSIVCDAARYSVLESDTERMMIFKLDVPSAFVGSHCTSAPAVSGGTLVLSNINNSLGTNAFTQHLSFAERLKSPYALVCVELPVIAKIKNLEYHPSDVGVSFFSKSSVWRYFLSKTCFSLAHTIRSDDGGMGFDLWVDALDARSEHYKVFSSKRPIKFSEYYPQPFSVMDNNNNKLKSHLPSPNLQQIAAVTKPQYPSISDIYVNV